MSRYHFNRVPHSIVFATTMSELYENHKINFDGINVGIGRTRHTSLDWFLTPKERPSIDKASVKEHYIDIPGMNGGLDLTESLTGYPLYDYIEGSFEFVILNDRKLPTLDSNGELVSEKEISWEVLNRDIRTFLNGKKRYMMLEDDPSWFYEGRFTVEKYDSSETANSKIVISYKVYPYKRLSTFWHNSTNYSAMYFDAVPLSSSDTRELLNSFRNKTDMYLYPGDSRSFYGDSRGQLPCGSEPATIIFNVEKDSNAIIPMVRFKRDDETIISPIEVEADTQPEDIKLRGVVLTNKGTSGFLYSDNQLTVSTPFPESYNPYKADGYKKGEYISYKSSQQSYITWILHAKDDVNPGIFRLYEWEADTDAMRIMEYTPDTPYNKDALVYVYSERLGTSSLILYKSLVSSNTGSIDDTTKWTSNLEDIEKKELYGRTEIAILYDIGVM